MGKPQCASYFVCDFEGNHAMLRSGTGASKYRLITSRSIMRFTIRVGGGVRTLSIVTRRSQGSLLTNILNPENTPSGDLTRLEHGKTNLPTSLALLTSHILTPL